MLHQQEYYIFGFPKNGKQYCDLCTCVIATDGHCQVQLQLQKGRESVRKPIILIGKQYCDLSTCVMTTDGHNNTITTKTLR